MSYSSPTDPVTTNSYDVRITVTVTSTGNRYDLTAYMSGSCRRGSFNSREPDMALQFGSTSEPWKEVQRPCGTGSAGRTTESSYEVTGSGTLAADRRVHLRAGAWGGFVIGTWGWGTRTYVVV
ncbi:hypothetical protein [Streptomyces roseifaciens]|uniref:hypothetical protein n=1 Tax=Streptomyces roseifaciens TaxID=1488406 RepID=UPI00118760B2|nr:hypothetical protein [Streptomyces roseifaciens]